MFVFTSSRSEIDAITMNQESRFLSFFKCHYFVSSQSDHPIYMFIVESVIGYDLLIIISALISINKQYQISDD
jgi:hypothetical protein